MYLFLEKKLLRISIVCFTLLFSCVRSYGQYASSSWSLTTNGNAVNTGAVSGGSHSFGPGLANTSYNPTTGASATDVADAAMNATKYFEYTISPTGGSYLLITSISSTNLASSGTANIQVQYSTSPSFSSPANYGAAFTQSSPAVTTTLTQPLIVNSGQTLYVRFFIWNIGNANRTFSSKDVIISGIENGVARKWDLTANGNGTNTGTGLETTGNHTFGSGVSSTSYDGTAGATGAGFTDASLNTTKYYQYAISPASGYIFTLKSILSTNQGNSNGDDYTILWQYSFDANFATAINYGSIFHVNSNIPTVNSQSQSVIINEGQTLYVRFYGWAGPNNPSKKLSQKDVIFSGVVTRLHIISASVDASGGGTISPSGNQTVSNGETLDFTITPAACHQVHHVEVDGQTDNTNFNPAGSIYRFTNITGDHSIVAFFTLRNAPSPPAASPQQTFCSGAKLSVVQVTPDNGNTIIWYAAPSGGGPLDPDGEYLAEGNKYYASQKDECNIESEIRTEVTVHLDSPLPEPLATLGATTACPGSTRIYGGSGALAPLAGVDYSWTVSNPATMTITGTDLQGSQCTVHFETGFTSGTMQLTATNSCGSVQTNDRPINPPTGIGQPAPLKVTGDGRVLSGSVYVCTNNIVTFSTDVGFFVDYYQWIIPDGSVFVDEQGNELSLADLAAIGNPDAALAPALLADGRTSWYTATNQQVSIRVKFLSRFTGTGKISLWGKNYCGQSTLSQNKTVNYDQPSTPAITVTGGGLNACAGESRTLTTNSIVNAAIYQWKVTAAPGSTGIKIGGEAINPITGIAQVEIPATAGISSALLEFEQNFSASSLSVTVAAQSACGYSSIPSAAETFVGNITPAQPTFTISGGTKVCPGSTRTLTSSTVSTASAFVWKVTSPDGISGVTIDGQTPNGNGEVEVATTTGKSIVDIGFSNTFTAQTCTVTVAGKNNCAIGLASAQKVFTLDAPNATISTSLSSVCKDGSSPVVKIVGSGGGANASYTFKYKVGSSGNISTVSTTNATTFIIPSSELPTGNAGQVTVYLLEVSSSNSALCTRAGMQNSVSYDVKSLPDITVSSDQALCSGIPITAITASTGTSDAVISWTRSNTGNVTGMPSSGTAANTADPQSISISGTLSNKYNLQQETTVFTLRATGSNSCTNSTPVNVAVDPKPVIAATPPLQTVCSGETIENIELTNSFADNGLIWNWERRSNANLSGIESGATSTISGILINGAASSQTATFDITATSSAGCIGTKTATVSVKAVPSATIKISSSAVCQGSPSTITLTGSRGSLPYTFSYNIDGGATLTKVASSGSSITFDPPTDNIGSHTYHLIGVQAGTNECSNSITGQSVTLTVDPFPSATISVIGDASVCQGSPAVPVRFTGSGGTPPYTFTYNINGGAVKTVKSPADDNSISVNVSTSVAAGFIYNLLSVKASSCTQAVTGQNATVTINAKPVPGVIQGEAFNVCGPANKLYSVINESNTSYSWTSSSAAATIPNGSDGATVNVSFGSNFSSTSLKVVATNNVTGCVSATSSLTVNAAPPVPGTIGGTTSLCPDDNFMFVSPGSSGATSYVWTLPAGVIINNQTDDISGDGSSTITGTWTPSTVTGPWTVKVSARNSCKTGGARSVSVSQGSCRISGETGTARSLIAIAYPNPANRTTSIKFNSEISSDYALTYTDLAGRNILLRNGTSHEGLNRLDLDLSNMPKGIYMMKLMVGDKSKTLRLVVE